MSALRAFDFETSPVRTAMIDGAPWFVGKDVCAALEISKHHQALDRLDGDERGTYNVGTPSGDQTMIVISEPGAYRLVFTSRTAAAERFKRWLAHEVLPALRREGKFEIAAPLAANDDEDDNLPMNADTRLWGVRLGKIRAAAAMIGTVARIYGPEAARRLYEAEPTLPDLKKFSVSALADTDMDDPTGCLHQLLRFKVSEQVTLGMLLRQALTEKLGRTALANCGVLVEPSGHRDHVLIASRHRFLQRVYAGTQWRSDWRFSLLQLKGASMLDGMRRFGKETSGGVLLPAETVKDAFLKGAPVAPPPA